MCSSKPPRPDPLIGQAARQQADIAQQQLDVARQQLEWEKDRAKAQDPLIQKIIDQQIASGDANAARAEAQWQAYRNLFAPMEERMVREAGEFDSKERQDRLAAEAGADVARGYRSALTSRERALARMGINPNSGRFQALGHEAGLNLARDTAGAMNKARRDTELQGMAMRQSAAQFGRNMPSMGIAADAAALNAGNSATGNLATQAGLHTAGMDAARNWFSGSTDAGNSAGNLMLNQFQGQLDAWRQQQQNKAAGLGGLGSLAGMLGGAYLLKSPGMRAGGLVKNGHAHGSVHLRRKGYAKGGVIEGPGTGTSDSIPAWIETLRPVRLSDGEAILNREAVELVGEDFIHRLNSGGLAMLAGKRATGDDREESDHVEGLGAFAGGLSEGLRSGLDMRMRQQYADRTKRSGERNAELHQESVGRPNLQAEKRKRLQAANAEIASGWERGHPDLSVPRQPSPPGLASVSTRRSAIADTRATGAAGLASLTGHKPEKRRTVTVPDEMIGRRMLMGNLPEDVDELVRMANIYKKHGLLEEMTPWMNEVYLAKKKGIPDALHSLLTGDARKARQILGRSGIRLAADPIPLRRTGRQQEIWRFQLEDGEEREIDLKEIAKRFFPGNI